MTDLTHAIQQLRWLIENDFHERHGQIWTNGVVSRHWWEDATRKKDIERVRSDIAGVRVMEAKQRSGFTPG